MKQADLKFRLAEADARVFRANLHVRQQREELTELRNAGNTVEAARAQAILEIFEDGLRQITDDRNFLVRSFCLTGAVEESE